jgi:hypothetical protein
LDAVCEDVTVQLDVTAELAVGDTVPMDTRFETELLIDALPLVKEKVADHVSEIDRVSDAVHSKENDQEMLPVELLDPRETDVDALTKVDKD